MHGNASSTHFAKPTAPAPDLMPRKGWSYTDLSELDAALLLDKEALHQQQLAIETTEVSPKEMWQLNRQQLAAQKAAQNGRAWRCNALYGKSIMYMPLLPERSHFVNWWTRLMMLIDLTYTTFYIPYTLVMNERQQAESFAEIMWIYIVDAVFGAFFFVNLVLQLHMPIRVSCCFYQLLVQYGRGVLYVYRTKGTFWIDLAAALPWFVQILLPAIPAKNAQAIIVTVTLLRLVRLYRVVRLVKMLAAGDVAPHSSTRFMSVSTWYLISLVFSACATINLLACVWYTTGSKGGGDSWMSSVAGVDLMTEPQLYRYIASVYFTVTTITTTGYGDITPKNEVEMVVAVVIMLIGALFMSFVIGTVAALINSGSANARRSQAFRSKVHHLDTFFSTNHTSRDVEKEVYKYYYYVWTRCEQESEEWQQVAADLPPGLRGRLVQSVLMHSCRGLLQQLSKGVPDAVMQVLCSAMDRQVLCPGHMLAAPGSPVDSIWLLRHGSIVAVDPSLLVSSQLGSLLQEDGSFHKQHSEPDLSHTTQQQQGTIFKAAADHQRRVLKPRPITTLAKALKVKFSRVMPTKLPSSTQSKQLSEHVPETMQTSCDVEAGTTTSQSCCVQPTDKTLPQLQVQVQLQQSRPTDDVTTGASVEQQTLDASCSDVVKQELQDRQHMAQVYRGPCVLPAYAAQHLKELSGNPIGTGISNGACCGSTGQTVTTQQQQPPPPPEQVHVVWLRCQGLCVVYKIDIAVLKQLCGLCSQLLDNVHALLKKTQQAQLL